MPTEQKKRTWKPIDVGGLRLYQVYLDWKRKGDYPTERETYVVAAKSPRQAARFIEQIYHDSYEDNPHVAYWYVTGYALNVYQPADWWEKGAPCLECEPERWQR